MEQIESKSLLEDFEDDRSKFTTHLEAELTGIKLDEFSNVEIMIDFISTVEKMFIEKIENSKFLSSSEKKESKLLVYNRLNEKLLDHKNLSQIIKRIKTTILKFFDDKQYFSVENINEEKEELFQRLSNLNSEREDNLNKFVRLKAKDLYHALQQELNKQFKTHYFPKVLLRDYKLKLRQRVLKIFLPEMRARLFTEDMKKNQDYAMIQVEAEEIFSKKQKPFSKLSPEKHSTFIELIRVTTEKYITQRNQSGEIAEESRELQQNLSEYLSKTEKSLSFSELTKEDLIPFYISSNYILMTKAKKKGIVREILLMTVKTVSEKKSTINLNIEKLFKVIEKICFSFTESEAKKLLNFDEILIILREELAEDLTERLNTFVENIPMKTTKKTFMESTKDVLTSIFFPYEEEDIKMNPSELNLLPYEEKNFSVNATILISGFVSSRDDFKITWENFIMDFDNFSEFYFFLWDSKTHFHMVRDIIRHIGGLSLTILTRNFLKLLMSIDTYLTHNNTFHKTKVMSKYCGVVLAYMIASEVLFKGRTVNLVGFSQGAAVIKYCLKELYYLTEMHPELRGKIQNVVLMGSAISLHNKEKWAKIFNIVSGRVVNCYSNADKVLQQIYTFLDEDDAVGAGPLDLGPTVPVENYNFSTFNIGHEDFRDYMNEIVKDINIF